MTRVCLKDRLADRGTHHPPRSSHRTLPPPIPSMDLRLQRLLLTVVPAFLVVGLVYAAIAGDDGLYRRHRMQVDLERVQRRLVAVEAENARLAREVGQLRGDEATVRGAIAEELLLVPEGSTVYRFQ
jgi:cell division protein FtsB